MLRNSRGGSSRIARKGVCRGKAGMYLENSPQKGDVGPKSQGEDCGFDVASGGHLIGVVRLCFGSMAQTAVKEGPQGGEIQIG